MPVSFFTPESVNHGFQLLDVCPCPGVAGGHVMRRGLYQRKITPELINRHHAIIFVTFTTVGYAPFLHALNHYRAAVLIAVNITAHEFSASFATGS
ncbi:Hypothetical protein c1494 [Escherichia coli CFT073]|uniref:Uncharacterized protein n=1 Tax=Escherichia coli O6:H1 (strain CFT073 / ATCC 700928 / UPEC) TaxID=199310 RepID=A0A0H2V6Q1_ECOL6|nr:Hypothetical protein c1494 [Escherichia coli CFT073]